MNESQFFIKFTDGAEELRLAESIIVTQSGDLLFMAGKVTQYALAAGTWASVERQGDR